MGCEAWITTDDFKELVRPLLQVFSMVIGYEINRPDEIWYGEPPDFEIEARG